MNSIQFSNYVRELACEASIDVNQLPEFDMN